MRVPFEWLKEFVPVDVDAADLARRITMRGLEVEAEEIVKPSFSEVVVGEILEMEPVSGADKLLLCKVDVGRDVLPVLCGASNIAQGNKVPVALPNARLGDGTLIEKRKIKGIESYGMLCSERELSLSEEHTGIFILPDNLRVGDTLDDALGLVDTVFDVNVPPNRGDCQSILGIAREVASILDKKVTLPSFTLTEKDDPESRMSLAVLNPDGCPRYVLRIIKNVAIVRSPFWMRNRIIKCGMRPISSIVDVTNYVMLELGQPLHAFDYQKLAKAHIEVRLAGKKAVFRSLDGADRNLESDDLMICDGDGPVAIAGIMGGENSEITSSTRDVALESAFFNPLFIRRTARRLDLRSEASLRFEKGIDLGNVDFAGQRAIYLMHTISGGIIVKGSKEFYEKKEPRTIHVSVKRASELIGMPVERENIVKALQSIDIPVIKREKEAVMVSVPSFRHDLGEYMDIVEEMARIIGFDNIPATVPVSRLMPVRQQKTKLCVELVKQNLVSSGFYEAINYGFFSEKDVANFLIPEGDRRSRYVTILNPISQELGVMRTMLSPGLLEALAYNVNRGVKHLKMFEVGKVFYKLDNANSLSGEGGRLLPEEPFFAGLAFTGKEREYFWRGTSPELDFFDLKGVLEGMLDSFGLPLRVNGTTEPFLNRFNAADICIGDLKVGWAGELKQGVLAAYGIEQKVYAAEVELTLLAERGLRGRRYEPIPRYPSMVRDFSFIIEPGIPVGSLINRIKEVSPLIVSVGVFDLFKREKTSVAFRVTFQSLEDTLRDETVNELQEVIIRSLTQIEGVELRA
ncbi:MAG TPA: phenylalanine--tRNA ligase subunit beta [Syntrophorhabdales bacterium]|nr:phenylalanine--tRNA ligase subunit beta [Syntrophorhabdales bacterium]